MRRYIQTLKSLHFFSDIFLFIGGILSESLARIGAKVTGIDPSEENISVAREHSKKDPLTEHINYRVSTIGYKSSTLSISFLILSWWFAEEIAKSEEKFDVVCSLEVHISYQSLMQSFFLKSMCYEQVIEHVQYPQLFIDCCSSSLKPGGSLFLSTINRTLKSYLVGIVAAEQVLGMVPAGLLIHFCLNFNTLKDCFGRYTRVEEVYNTRRIAVNDRRTKVWIICRASGRHGSGAFCPFYHFHIKLLQ